MQLKSDTLKLDGMEFSTQQFPAMLSFELLARLTTCIGPALGALMKLDPSAQLESVGSELAAAFGSLNPKEATALVPEVLSMTSVLIQDATGGRSILLNTVSNINTVFSGRLKAMFSVLAFVLKTNYADFIQGSNALGAALPSLSSNAA